MEGVLRYHDVVRVSVAFHTSRRLMDLHYPAIDNEPPLTGDIILITPPQRCKVKSSLFKFPGFLENIKSSGEIQILGFGKII